MTPLVFDSSALLAFLRDETGADTVETLFRSGAPCYAHAVNLCETFYRIVGLADFATAQARIDELHALGIEERSDLDSELWRDAAMLIADRRRVKRPLALGDAIGTALARRLNADFVTADKSEFAAIVADNAARIIFIR